MPSEIKPKKLLIKKEVNVKGYTKKDGTIVTPSQSNRLINPNKHINSEINSSHVLHDEEPTLNTKHVYDSDPKTWGITRSEAKDMFDRNFNVFRDSYENRKEYDNEEPYNLSLSLDSDSETYNRYLRNLPENISSIDVIHAYRENLLPETKIEPEKTPRIPLTEKVKTKIQDRIGEPQIKKSLKPEDAKDLYQLASQRRTTKNKDSIDDARYKIFMDHMLTPDLHNKLGIDKKELNSKIKSWTGMTKESSDLQRSFNEGITTPIQWTGIENSSYLSKQRIKPNDLDQFFNHIDNKEGSGWNSPNGDMLRNYVARAILGIDTRINYTDLSLHIDNTLKPRGLYSPGDTSIKIRAKSAETVAHELGHYLDNKWGREAGMGKNAYASSLMDSVNRNMFRERTSDIRMQWNDRFHEFVKDISNRSDISSEYTQDRKEVFARFVDKFVSWTNEKAGLRSWGGNENRYNDKFTTRDFHNFTRLLQEKAYVDIVDKNKFGIKKIRNKK